MDNISCFLSFLLKFIRFSSLKRGLIGVLFCLIPFQLFSNIIGNEDDSCCQLILLHETLKPLELKKAVIYFSASRFLIRKDSICINFSTANSNTDTIIFNEKWKYPVYLKLNLLFSDLSRYSNTFHYDAQIRKWEVSILDSSLMVHHKPVGDDFKRRNSLNGLVLIIDTALEMLIALLISRLFGWSHLLVLMVMVANVAAFPIYLLSIPNLFLRESLVATIKLLVMLVIGYKKITYYKIILFALILMLIGLGIKEFLFLLSSII
jgi:hypothetical protein